MFHICGIFIKILIALNDHVFGHICTNAQTKMPWLALVAKIFIGVKIPDCIM